MSLQTDFSRYHADNPHVYETVRDLSRRWVDRRPGEPCGIGMLFEVARWTINLTTFGDPFKLNNNYRAFYARMLMANEPELAGLFKLRRQRGGA